MILGRRWRRHILPVGVLVVLSCGRADAQPTFAVGADVTFYGDNTEFRNPFREGETIFGAALRLSAISEVSDRIAITIGAFGNQRFGSDDGFELVRPILSLTVSGRRSRFVFGTFPVRSPETLSGPDLDGPIGCCRRSSARRWRSIAPTRPDCSGRSTAPG